MDIHRLWKTGVLLAVVAGVAGCGGESVSSRVSGQIGERASCDKVGLMVVAGRRETVYACDRPDYSSAGCYAVADGQLVDVTEEASAIDAPFGC